MARELEIDSLRYLSVRDLGPSIGIDGSRLCTGCVTGRYPTPCGNRLMKLARLRRNAPGRAYE
jgi:glutamine phosphoribosylpyrophosphate amidotransferase